MWLMISPTGSFRDASSAQWFRPGNRRIKESAGIAEKDRVII
jgi:hypothetical protein